MDVIFSSNTTFMDNITQSSEFTDGIDSDTMNTTTSMMMTTSYKGKPTLYLSQDEALKQFTETQIAWVLDTVYGPICSIFGIIGNALSFLVLIFSKASTTYQYMAAISCTDTLVLILNIMFLVRKFPGHEIFHTGTCGLIFFVFYFAIHLNVVLMLSMTVERYIAIRFPLRAQGWFSVKRARILILLQVFLVFALNLHNFFTRKMIPSDDGNSTMCSSEGEMNRFFVTKVWPWIDAVWYCYFPLACLCMLNVMIVIRVKQAAKTQRKMTQSSHDSKVSHVGRDRQVTVMLLLVTFCFLLFVSPMAVIIVVEKYYWSRDTLHEEAVYHLVRTIFNNMMYTNHALNFLLYFLSGRRFRDQFTQIFCRSKLSKSNLSKSRSTLTINTRSISNLHSESGSSVNIATITTSIPE